MRGRKKGQGIAQGADFVEKAKESRTKVLTEQQKAFRKRIDEIDCKEELTPEKLRTFKGLEHVSDQEAEHIIRTIEKFTQLTFRYFHSIKQLYEK